MVVEEGPLTVEQNELVECDHRRPHVLARSLSGPDSYPSNPAADPVRLGLVSDPADSDHSVELPPTDSAHAPVDAKLPRPVRISSVRSFINECAKSSA